MSRDDDAQQVAGAVAFNWDLYADPIRGMANAAQVCYKEVGTFTSPASTTPQTQDVPLSTFAGRMPCFVIIWATRQTSAGVATRCLFSIGFGTSNSNRAAGAMNEDEALTSDEDRAHSNAAVIITTQSNDFAPATIFERGDISALAADKFTIDWEVLDASAYRYHYAAFGGTAVEANVVTFISQTADATAQNVPHGLSGIPTGVFGFSSHNLGAGGIPNIDGAGQADMSIFASDLTTDRWTGVSASAGVAKRGQLATAATHNDPSGIIEKSTITDADATNLEFTWELGDTAEYFHLLVVRGVDVEVGKFTSPTTATTRQIPMAIQPDLFLNWGWMDVAWPTPDAFGLDDVRLMFGASDGTNQSSIGAFIQDTSGEADRFDSSTDCLRVYTHPAMGLQEAATAAISDTLVTLTFSSAVAAENEFNYVGIGCQLGSVPLLQPETGGGSWEPHVLIDNVQAGDFAISWRYTGTISNATMNGASEAFTEDPTNNYLNSKYVIQHISSTSVRIWVDGSIVVTPTVATIAADALFAITRLGSTVKFYVAGDEVHSPTEAAMDVYPASFSVGTTQPHDIILYSPANISTTKQINNYTVGTFP